MDHHQKECSNWKEKEIVFLHSKLLMAFSFKSEHKLSSFFFPLKKVNTQIKVNVNQSGDRMNPFFNVCKVIKKTQL